MGENRAAFTFASKVGTVFSQHSLQSLHRLFQKYRTTTCPFADLQARAGRLSAAELRSCVWLKPRLVCEVRFQERTRDGNLRQPVMLGLREDKRPEQVTREQPASRAREANTPGQPPTPLTLHGMLDVGWSLDHARAKPAGGSAARS